MDKTPRTYLGQKGYTIHKTSLTVEQEKKIRNDLTIKPFIMGSPIHNQHTFPAYRESQNKIYVPHYYGIEHFGLPQEYKIVDGVDIDLKFEGELRDYQEPVVNKFIQHCEKAKYGGGLLELPCAWGKTSGSLYILSKLKKKTLVIVHKEFLLNQWVERIHQFLPKARVGKIQGPIIDIDDKDIVIGMLQSLAMKEYPPTVFESFGLTIIDEVHHISSEVFSNSLFKLVTKYMLGLSATMNRKDGTTHVFKMFLGEVIFKGEKKNENVVEVRAITYKVNDEEFNETILDYKGQPQNSSMISKLCEYNPRTEFIIKLISDFISVDDVNKEDMIQHKNKMDKEVPNCEICKKNNNYLIRNTCCDCVKYCLNCMENIENNNSSKRVRPKCPNCLKVLKYQQNYIDNPYVKPLEHTHTIVMAQNLNILHYIYKKFVCKNLASVGYYIGGMSEMELKKTEKKQIVLASYQMSSEGLDIPTLNAEFLITPKTDIVQTVGRILRAKHKLSSPIIYDIVDAHDVFQRQWLKRKAYYKSQNFKIIGTNSLSYTDISNWKVIYEQKNGCAIIKTNTSDNKTKKNASIKSNSSTDKSVTNDSDPDSDSDSDVDHYDTTEEKPKDKYLCGKCLLSIKK
jgi:superfamily II DNA or RNA helicase